MGPLLTHLTTHKILKRIFPNTFKIDKIAPKHKTGKPIYDMGSYRPINNLCTIEKIIKEYFIGHLSIFHTENDIINNNHHGGRKGHSTITALNQILNTIHINYNHQLQPLTTHIHTYTHTHIHTYTHTHIHTCTHAH